MFAVYDGTSIYSKRLVKLPGTFLQVGEILSLSNALTVQMKSDGSVNYAGFRAMYKTVLVININDWECIYDIFLLLFMWKIVF